MKSGIAPKSKPYEIELSSAAEAVYIGFRRRALVAQERGASFNYHITAFNVLRDAFRLIQANPLDRRYALAGNLSSMYRLKKGRMRICWIASLEQRRICILYISETLRKDGDAHDPYAIFTKMVMSGQFNELFRDLGIGSPVGKSGESYLVQ